MRTMIILAFALSTTAADAASFGRTTTCARYGGSISCKSEGYYTGSRYYGGSRPTIIQQVAPLTAAELGEQAERIHDWEKFCKPTENVDNLGVTRYSYAQPGCEFGRTK